MTLEKVLYTDGHEVTVTESVFKVKKTMYDLKGITKHGFLIIPPHRLAPLLLALTGVLMTSLGIFHAVPRSIIPDVVFHARVMSGNIIALILGLGLLVVSSIALGLMKDRYAIRIATAEGEKNVVISNRKEYVYQILDALNKAFINLVSPKQEELEKLLEMRRRASESRHE